MSDMKSNVNQESYLAKYMTTEKEGGGFLKVLALSLNMSLSDSTIERIESSKQYGGVFLFQIKDTATINIESSNFTNVKSYEKGTLFYIESKIFSMSMSSSNVICTYSSLDVDNDTGEQVHFTGNTTDLTDELISEFKQERQSYAFYLAAS